MQLSDLTQGVDLFPHNTLRVRAKAQYFVLVRTREELVKAIQLASLQQLPLRVLGGGSNIALAHSEMEGIVVKNLYMKKENVAETDEYVDVKVSSGYPVTKLINELSEEGLSGLEHHLGLPGTVGGAIYMNSKWTHPVTYFGDPLVSATLLTKDGHEKQVDRDYFNFAYDYSTLQKTGEVLLEVTFRLKKDKPASVTKRAHEAHEYRKKTQPTGVASSGCFFQNITPQEQKMIGESTQSAGNLIDKSGLKGYRHGAFVVSPVHANFIINEGGGNPDDLKELIGLMKSKVKDKFGIELKQEVVVL